MAVQESLRPQPVKTTDQRRPVRQALAATAASLGLLAGVVAAGAALSGTWSVSAAWNRAVATVTALPEYRVALSLFEDGSSADFARDLLAAELDSAAVGESLFFLPVRDLLETAAAFEGVGVEGVTLVEGGFMAWISGGEEAVRQTAERLRQMAAYGDVRLEADLEDPGITRLYCLTAGAEEEE